MGCNYYAVQKKPSLYREILHIGKSSIGWKFAFQGYQGDKNIKSIQDWKDYIKKNDLVILDEYDREMSYNDFFEFVERLQKNENKDNFTHDVNVGGYRFDFNDFS